ncbi:MAG: ribonuclease HIII [Candidatus Zixiibacteriota bacterium]
MPVARRIIGVDESGKGDFFGPLVVAAVLASDDAVDDLQHLGVRDGKLIADKKLLSIDLEIRRKFPHSLVVVTPEKYNRTYATIKNLNKLLAACHARAIASLLKKSPADMAISDKFGKPELVEDALQKLDVSITLEQVVRGEAILQVAAASILARAAFLRGIQRLSKDVGVELPKGAGAIVDEVGRKIAARQSPSIFEKIAKTHFKNYGRILRPQLFK